MMLYQYRHDRVVSIWMELRYGSDRFRLQQQHRYKRNEESNRFSREKSESRGKNREVWRRKKTSWRQAV